MCVRSSQSVRRKLLPCFFSSLVSCSFRKSEKFGVMNRCLWCEHYKRFCDEMEKEEEELFAEVDEMRKGSRRGGSVEQTQE